MRGLLPFHVDKACGRSRYLKRSGSAKEEERSKRKTNHRRYHHQRKGPPFERQRKSKPQVLAGMANAAQCYYCFETLAASFEDREPTSLAAIEALWEQHEQSKKLSHLKAKGEGAFSDEDADNDEEPCLSDTVYGEDDSGDTKPLSGSNRPHGLKVPSFNRLQTRVPSDSSSAATTPSCTSNTSSNSHLSSSTAATTPGSQSDASGSRNNSSNQRYPLFVTWNTLSRSGSKSLRGCIGTFEAQDLSAGLKSYARTS